MTLERHIAVNDTEKATESDRAKPRRGCRRRLLIAAGVVVAVLLVVLLVGWWRLSRGPISLAFLEPRLQWTLGAADEAKTLSIKGPVLTWGGWRRPIDLRAGPVTLTDSRDRAVLELRDVSVGLATSQLVRGKVALTRVEVSSIHLQVLRTADGRFAIGFEPTEKQPKPQQDEAGPTIQEQLQEFLTSPDPGPLLGDLTRISIVDSRLTVDDRVLGVSWGAPEVGLHLTRQERGVDVAANATFELGSRSTEIDVDAAFTRATERLQAQATIKALEPAVLAEGVPALAVLEAFDLPVDLRVEADISIDGEIHSVDVDVDSARGRVTGGLKRADDGTLTAQAKLADIHLWEFEQALAQLGAIRVPVNGQATALLSPERRLEAATVELETDLGNVSGNLHVGEDGGLTAQATLEKIHLWELADLASDLGRVGFPIDGQIGVELTSDRSIHGARVQLTGGRGSIRVPEIQGRPIALNRLQLEATVGDGAQRIELGELTVALDGLSIHAEATASRGARTTRVEADASLSDIDASRIDEYWPSRLVPDVLDWISTNITAGTVHDARAHVGLSLPSDLSGGGRLDVLRGSFAFRDLSVAYLAPMPPATGITGTGAFTDQGFDFAVRGGGVRDISIGSAEAQIAPLSGSTRLGVDANGIDGPVRTAMEVLASPPLALIGEALPQPEQFSGHAVTHLELGVPLSSRDPQPLSVSGASRLEGVGLTGWVEGFDVSDGALDLDFDLSRMDVTGTADVNGVSASFQWRENIAGQETPRTVHATTTLDDDDRSALGIPAISQIAGPIDVTIDLTGRQDGAMAVELGADLLHTALDVGRIGWSKAAGEGGALTAEAIIGADWAVDVRRFGVEAGDLRSVGRLSVKPKLSGLGELVLGDLEYGDNQIAGSLAMADDGRWKIEVTGRRFDVGPLLKPSSSPEESSAKEPSASPRTVPSLAFDVRIDELVSGPEHRFGGLRATCHHDGTVFEDLNASLQITADNALVVRVDPAANGGLDLRVTAANAGEVLGALSANSEFDGGALEITGHKPARDQALSGHFQLDDFKVTESDVLMRLLQIGSVGGAIEALQGKDLGFSRLESDFEFLNKKLEIVGFRTHGESIGLTADGHVDFAASVLDLRGVVVPASRMQQLLGKIPVLGTILTGTKGTGLVAVNYTVKGPSDAPKITAQPLSVLTAGILRDLFHIDDEKKAKKRKD